MKIFDMHIHAWNTKPDPETLIRRLEENGVYGGCVFSNEPDVSDPKAGTSFEERLAEALAWCVGYEDRLFPILWIHPDEENILEKVHIAADRGIAGFKFICNNYYVYEDKMMTLLREIAKRDKPVIFHSGILWSGTPSSQYNRPVHWEALMDIPGLRFSMGHCSWPWIDECVALYGAFQYAHRVHNAAEMFFDITPGTPLIYREELLRKLYTVGYDVGDNILYGTDASANDYRDNWLDTDRKILDEIGVSKALREKLYYSNLLRFLGKSNAEVQPRLPAVNGSNDWTPYNDKVNRIIRKWYKELKFPDTYDLAFEEALRSMHISDAIDPATYDHSTPDGKRHFLSYLFFCEQLEKRYAQRGIDRKILLDTMWDLLYWTQVWTDLKGDLYFGEACHVRQHVNFTLFRLGSLQFCFDKAEEDVPEKGIVKGENVIGVHIPAMTDLSKEACDAAFAQAKAFFATHFPEYEYRYFTCHSWMLDDKLKELLSPQSKIIDFQNRFEVVDKMPSNGILRFTFKWDTNPFNLRWAVPTSGFAEKVKARALAGETFYAALGVIDKETI